MIRLDTAHIEEFRGIRTLDVDFSSSTFAISGPNGSGKSGVIDAIEFGLTGGISRLSGRGTRGLTIAEHGPHVDKSRFPDAAFVTLELTLVESGKKVSLTRRISSPKKPVISPADPDVVAALAAIADHPELTLSRREILRFILVEPTKRSEEIQALLKLDDVGHTRAALNTAQNRLHSAQKVASGRADGARTSLLQHLQITSLKLEDVLSVVNPRRTLLGLDPIASITTETQLDSGIDASEAVTFNKQAILRDMSALQDLIDGNGGQDHVDAILANLDRLADDPELRRALQQRSLVQQGLELAETAECPLCDIEWANPNELRAHLEAKLFRSQEAKTLEAELLASGSAFSAAMANIRRQLAGVHIHAVAGDDLVLANALIAWGASIDGIKAQVTSADGMQNIRSSRGDIWFEVPREVRSGLRTFKDRITALPDQAATADARAFLATANLRLHDFRENHNKRRVADEIWKRAQMAYQTYCEVLEDELNTLYTEVQEDFSKYYREINADDEARFTAKLTPTEGSLALDVNFYERGLFPPGAYHSEGHQDGMGVCLYLALMKRLFGGQFTFALLDDVVMSVDSSHRYQFCRLLKTAFPQTQFIITTHDRLWAEQMRSAGLVTSKTSLAFHGWTVDTGPLVESNEEIWTEIDAALDRGKVEVAAAALRHHLEYVSRLLADQLGASTQFRSDGSYELGDLLPNVLRRLKELLGRASDAAQSWGNNVDKEAASTRKAALSSCNGALNVEQWAVNKAVHYNEWANFGRTDFRPVVVAFRELLDCFRCPSCGSWLFAGPRHAPESLRCPCSAVNLNLKSKPK